MANPTIGATTPRIQYTATASQTVFTVPFEFLANADLAVYVNGTLKTLTTDYTLTGANTTGGGTLTFVTGRTAGDIVTILGNLAYSRDTNKYTKYGLLPAEVLEADFDAMQVQAKQLARDGQFALRAPLTDTGSPAMTLPVVATRASKVLGFDASGNPTVSASSVASMDAAVSVINTIAASSSGNAGSVVYTPAGTGAQPTTVQTKLRETVSVKDFGAAGDGTTDDTAAIQAAINASSGFRAVYFPTGTYKVTSTITIANDRVGLFGDGVATRILFVPTASAVCFLFDKGSASSVQNFVRDMAFYSSDTTYTKTAIKLIDVSECLLQNIQTISPHWSGNGSIFLHILGRDSTAVQELNVYADLPIKISPIPAPHTASGIGIDHFNFHNCYLISSGSYPIVTIDSGVNVTHTSFDGFQAWVQGTYGLYWNDTTSTATSIGLSIKNVRWEQVVGAAGYLIYIAHNTGLDQLLLENIYGGITSNFLYFRKVKEFTLNNVFYPGALVGADVDSTCTSGTFSQVTFNNNAATVTLGAKRLSGDYKIGGNQYHLVPNAPTGSSVVQKWNQSATLGFNQLEPQAFTVAGSTTVTFSTNGLRGLVFIYATGGTVSAVMAVNGTSNSTKLLSQSDAGWFGTAVGAANINLYWDGAASVYKLQNNIGTSMNFYVVTMGIGERA